MVTCTCTRLCRPHKPCQRTRRPEGSKGHSEMINLLVSTSKAFDRGCCCRPDCLTTNGAGAEAIRLMVLLWATQREDSWNNCAPMLTSEFLQMLKSADKQTNRYPEWFRKEAKSIGRRQISHWICDTHTQDQTLEPLLSKRVLIFAFLIRPSIIWASFITSF